MFSVYCRLESQPFVHFFGLFYSTNGKCSTKSDFAGNYMPRDKMPTDIKSRKQNVDKLD
jgi:hypothetical protein